MLNETKIICGYTCYKAVTEIEVPYSIINQTKKETITVWYTPEINVPFGPLDRDGLPGLVLETNFKNIFYIAKKVILNPTKKIIIKKPIKGKKISNKEYEQRVNIVINLIKSKIHK